jgi:glycosyltransferase involved in cell wall biosynthesis
MPEFISILGASLNSEKHIRRNLSSVYEQKFSGVEHIIIDGDSKDDTINIIKRYQNKYLLEYVSEPDEGIADALNKGLTRLKGKYVLVLHADDRLISRDVLKKIYPVIKSEEHDIYSFPVLVNCPKTGMKPCKPFPLHWWYHFKTIIPHQGAFVHRRVYEKIGGFRKEFTIGMDYDFFYRAFKAKCTVNRQKEFVSVMGGAGISNNPQALEKRLAEEHRVQQLNEENVLWKMAQMVFRFIYMPYKTKLLSKF